MSHNFVLIDEREHKFIFNNINVGFAKKSILIKDKIIKDYTDLVNFGEIEAYTLQLKNFLAAYRFSLKDGYRLTHRMKKDQDIIDKLIEYIKKDKTVMD